MLSRVEQLLAGENPESDDSIELDGHWGCHWSFVTCHLSFVTGLGWGGDFPKGTPAVFRKNPRDGNKQVFVKPSVIFGQCPVGEEGGAGGFCVLCSQPYQGA